jgi:hypothetical protein
MADQHTVTEGETLLTIAAANGFLDWKPIWQHEKNEALRKQRDPTVLTAGDVIYLPEVTEVPIPVTSGQRQVITQAAIRASFRTTVVDEHAKPLANCKFTLAVGGVTLRGKTNSSGVVECDIPAAPLDGTLTIYAGKDEKPLTFSMKLGYLDPIEKDTGVKARLNNLGFECGDVAGKLDDDATKAALRTFQIVHRLPVTGSADAATRKRLKAAHDRRPATP